MGVAVRKLPLLRFDGKSLGPRKSCARRLLEKLIAPVVREIVRAELRERDDRLKAFVAQDNAQRSLGGDSSADDFPARVRRSGGF